MDGAEDDLSAGGGAEGGFDESEKVDVNELIATRKAKLSYLTRQKNVITTLINNDDDLLDVCGRFKRFENTLTEFLDLQAQVQQLLSASDRETDRTNWFEPKRLVFEEFMDYAKGWIQSQPAHEAESLPLECLRMNPFPALPHPPDNIQPEDSISTTSSQRSASARMRTEAECAGLLAKAKALKKKPKLDLEAARIKTQQEKVELEAEMAAATAKLEVLRAISTPPRIKGATSQPIMSTVRADKASNRAHRTLELFDPSSHGELSQNDDDDVEEEN